MTNLPTATKADHDLAHDIRHPNALSYEDRVECNIGEPLPLLLALMRIHGYEMPRRNGDTMNDKKQAGSEVVGEDGIKRYSLVRTGSGRTTMQPFEHGLYVKYMDHKARVEQSAGAAAPVEGKSELPALDVTPRCTTHEWLDETPCPDCERFKNISALLDEVASLREEAKRLLTQAHHATGNAVYQQRRAEKAEAELATLRSQRDEAFNEGIEAAASDIQPEGEPYTDVVEAIRGNIRQLKRPIPTLGGTR